MRFHVPVQFTSLATALLIAGLTSNPSGFALGQDSRPPSSKSPRPEADRPGRPRNDKGPAVIDGDHPARRPARKLFEGEGGGSVPEGSRVEKPRVLDSKAELNRVVGNLAERFPKRDIPEKVEGVDLGEQKVLYFAWAGSGGDQLSVRRGQPRDGRSEAGRDRPGGGDDRRHADVVFLFRPGMTRDLRSHFAMFALPRGTTFRVETVRPQNQRPVGDRPNSPRPGGNRP